MRGGVGAQLAETVEQVGLVDKRLTPPVERMLGVGGRRPARMAITLVLHQLEHRRSARDADAPEPTGRSRRPVRERLDLEGRGLAEDRLELCRRNDQSEKRGLQTILTNSEE
jgi:hypothetical protein